MTLNEQLAKMLEPHSPAVKTILLKVIMLEQENISMERPRLAGEIDKIIHEVALSALEEDA
jgi:hypothetical protein